MGNLQDAGTGPCPTCAKFVFTTVDMVFESEPVFQHDYRKVESPRAFQKPGEPEKKLLRITFEALYPAHVCAKKP